MGRLGCMARDEGGLLDFGQLCHYLTPGLFVCLFVCFLLLSQLL